MGRRGTVARSQPVWALALAQPELACLPPHPHRVATLGFEPVLRLQNTAQVYDLFWGHTTLLELFSCLENSHHESFLLKVETRG